jgi:hypothetical protein
MTDEITANALFGGPDRGLLENVVLRHDNGIITSISEGAAPPPARRTFVIPALVNAHDHARPTASSFGAVDMPLESWIIRSAFGTPNCLRSAESIGTRRNISEKIVRQLYLFQSSAMGRSVHGFSIRIDRESNIVRLTSIHWSIEDDPMVGKTYETQEVPKVDHVRVHEQANKSRGKMLHVCFQ